MRRIGLSNPRKPGKRSNKKKEERDPQPLVTPAQRILQQQWLQPAGARERPKFKLPRGTEIAIVPVHKKAKTVSVDDEDSLMTILEKATVMPRLVSPVESDEGGTSNVVERDVVGDIHQPSNAAIENVVEMAPTTCRGVVVEMVPTTCRGVVVEMAPTTSRGVVVEMAPTTSRGVDQPSQALVEEEEGPEKQASASQEAEDERLRTMGCCLAEAMHQIEKRSKNITFLQRQLDKEKEAKKKWEKRVAAYQELFGKFRTE